MPYYFSCNVISAPNPRLGSRAFCSAGPCTKRITRTLPYPTNGPSTHALLHPGRDWLFSFWASGSASRFQFWCCSCFCRSALLTSNLECPSDLMSSFFFWL
ncbi:hypothetical protein K443DRAFT_632522 [Laccaria amethystina LaAM-08-1]|uniref:Uncharacterized protein n=1 Tax=Laccaria amethystina LaAM-08-1 TaxID=1095629 RepID=A0A0C9WWY7_9AGAR|nr:hypothetical protein K443DRAFT_632522 [Laccaria amethystina LaAM-08-1]